MDLTKLNDKVVFANGSNVPVAYILTHSQSGRMYIGSTGNAYSRAAFHRSTLDDGTHPVKELQSDYDDSADIRIHYWVTDSKQEALEIEQQLVDHFWETGLLYNTGRNVSKPRLGATITDDHKEAISLTHKNKSVSVETRAKMAEAQLYRWKSDDRRQQMREKMKHRERAVSIDGAVFVSLAAASRATGTNEATLRSRLLSKSLKYADWKYLT